MSRRSALSFSVSLFFATTAVAADAVPGVTREFLSLCANDRPLCTDKILELSLFEILTPREAAQDPPARHHCTVTAFPESHESLVTQVIDWLNAHSEIHQTSTDSGIRAAFDGLYGCQR